VGDLLEAPDGVLRIFKFVGFEEAHWVVPEAKPEPNLEEAGAQSEEMRAHSGSA
jgi:hypothetical protein